jgi:hypothetical protein
MSEKKSSSSISFCGLLAIAFIVLKLTKVISWSWLWVLSPLWIPLALALVIFIVYFIIKLIQGILESKNHNSWIKEEAEKHKAEWHAGIPEVNKPLSFCVNKKWHNGRYVDGKFKIIGSDTYFETAEAWYYK